MKKTNTPILWPEILKQVLATDQSFGNRISFAGSTFNFQFVADPLTRLGFLLIWETESRRAIHVSRVKVPDGLPFTDIDQETSGSIPQNLLFESIG